MPTRLTLLLTVILAAVVIPFLLWGERVELWTGRFLASGAARPTVAAAMGALLALDVLLPVPSSIVSTGGSALLGFWPGLAVSWAGMSAGCMLGYWLGTRAPVRRYLKPEEVVRLERARSRYGRWLLIVLRPVPVLAEASVFFAGVSRLPLGAFAALVLPANFGVSAVYAATGAMAARLDSFLWVFAGAVLLPAAGMWFTRRRG